MAKKPEPVQEHLTVRVPTELKNKIREAAERDFRTLSGQILFYLQRGLDHDRTSAAVNQDKETT